MKTVLTFFTFFLIIINADAQTPAIDWSHCYGGSLLDGSGCIRQTTDGGYIFAGSTNSSDSDVSKHYGATSTRDVWIVKTNSKGIITWTKVYGGTGDDEARAIEQTADGGYIIAGSTTSTDGDIKGFHTGAVGADMLILKLDTSGNLSWQKCLGGSYDDRALSIKQSAHGGYIVAGYATSNDGDVLGIHLNSSGNPTEDVWVVKLNDTGRISWQKTFGGSDLDFAMSIQQVKDSGYIIAGATYSDDGDMTKNYDNTSDAWIAKIDVSGSLSWQKSLGGTQGDIFYSAIQTTDGGYIATGSTFSTDNDVSGLHVDTTGTLNEDVWVVKVDSAGKFIWQKCYGGTSRDIGYDIRQTIDGGYVVAGCAGSIDGDVAGMHTSTARVGRYDYWILQLASNGSINWQKCLGGTDADIAFSIEQTSDGGYVTIGGAYSTDGDVAGNHGQSDAYVVKLQRTAGVLNVQSNVSVLTISPNPSHNSFTLQYHLSTDAGVVITDVAGRVVAELTIAKNTRQATINASVWQPGTYFYKVLQSGQVLESGKLVKE